MQMGKALFKAYQVKKLCVNRFGRTSRFDATEEGESTTLSSEACADDLARPLRVGRKRLSDSTGMLQ